VSQPFDLVGNAQTGAKSNLESGLMAAAIPAFPTAPVHVYPNYDHRHFWEHESHNSKATPNDLWAQRGLPGS